MAEISSIDQNPIFQQFGKERKKIEQPAKKTVEKLQPENNNEPVETDQTEPKEQIITEEYNLPNPPSNENFEAKPNQSYNEPLHQTQSNANDGGFTPFLSSDGLSVGALVTELYVKPKNNFYFKRLAIPNAFLQAKKASGELPNNVVETLEKHNEHIKIELAVPEERIEMLKKALTKVLSSMSINPDNPFFALASVLIADIVSTEIKVMELRNEMDTYFAPLFLKLGVEMPKPKGKSLIEKFKKFI